MNRNARHLLIAAALVAMAAIFFLTLFHRPTALSRAGSPAGIVAPTPPPAARASLPSGFATTTAPSDPHAGTGVKQSDDPAATGPRYYAGVAAATQRQAADADAALQTVAFAVRDYLAALGQVPIGSNPEITRALMGENTRNAHYLRADLPINAQGELVDRWGTPYFFHQISRTQIDLYSAGPDRTMWTADDEITR